MQVDVPNQYDATTDIDTAEAGNDRFLITSTSNENDKSESNDDDDSLDSVEVVIGDMKDGDKKKQQLMEYYRDRQRKNRQSIEQANTRPMRVKKETATITTSHGEAKNRLAPAREWYRPAPGVPEPQEERPMPTRLTYRQERHKERKRAAEVDLARRGAARRQAEDEVQRIRAAEYQHEYRHGGMRIPTSANPSFTMNSPLPAAPTTALPTNLSAKEIKLLDRLEKRLSLKLSQKECLDARLTALDLAKKGMPDKAIALHVSSAATQLRKDNIIREQEQRRRERNMRLAEATILPIPTNPYRQRRWRERQELHARWADEHVQRLDGGRDEVSGGEVDRDKPQGMKDGQPEGDA
ncbi:hypothetical protein B0T17DRAFT_525136 [Bombardia bombarda]|uniref:Uncharacterized protein n=1 Tax=Bombardia bombarda TaxID=252184 RepID=A0AA39X8G8_9PEZI|nr:hypothetical protein B0T17DRAFT_525136 [Bombardia bombarda]